MSATLPSFTGSGAAGLKECAQAQSRPRVAIGVDLAQQLDLFSEPTESSDQLRESAERRVAFHTADLSPQERQVIEGGFAEGKFEVRFATSTLAAGVNFLLRVHGGTLSAVDFMTWLCNPGVAELERLGGNPTYIGK